MQIKDEYQMNLQYESKMNNHTISFGIQIYMGKMCVFFHFHLHGLTQMYLIE